MDNSALPTTATMTTTTTTTTTPAPKPIYELWKVTSIELKAPFAWAWENYEETHKHFISNLQGTHET